MASGMESEVEDVEALEYISDGSTAVSRSKEKVRIGTDSRESAVWIYFEKTDQVGSKCCIASCRD